MNKELQNVHIIAVGGAVMSSLAIALNQNGINVTGSDDKIYDPAKSNLASKNLLPQSEGWDTSNIHKDLDTVIVGMHAKIDNPELLKAQELDLNIVSYPEFVRQQSENKQRVVIAGSHGKTTITGMVIHVLNHCNKSFDYLIGAQINGIDNTIKFSESAPVIIIEGDEYFTSPLDPSPKFSKYDHHIALISGTSWDHYNVYPTIDSYVEQFEKLADKTPKAGTLVYCEADKTADRIGRKERDDVKGTPYNTPKYEVKDGIFYLITKDRKVPLKVFGKHNLQNMEGARLVLDAIGVTSNQFYEAIGSYEGADKRSTLIQETDAASVYYDYAHAPSKVKATVSALKELHPERTLTACYELHTFSSLNKDFLPQYDGTLDKADQAILFINSDNAKLKDIASSLSKVELTGSFKRKDIQLFTKKEDLESYLKESKLSNHDLLMMSSGNFGGLDIPSLAEQLLA
ncbi:MAG: Mur ligase family protein [Reichenbachiella sp.]